MEIVWNDAPVTGSVVYSRDVFEKFTLTPTIHELFAFLHSEEKPESSKPACKKDDPEPNKDNVSAQLASESKQTTLPTTAAKTDAFPEPLLPYPCLSSLSSKEHELYLFALKKKSCNTLHKKTLERVRSEVTKFMKYLQDVSQAGAGVYNYVPPGGIRYVEEYFAACMEHTQSFPPIYNIQEITSLSSRSFFCEISLNFEKQLLAMGTVGIVGKKVFKESHTLAVDYETISSAIPPAKKADLEQLTISKDSNVEKLSTTYGPHICLSKEAFIQLLNNNSEFNEPWEIPVLVKPNPKQDNSQHKTAYIDPPLQKSEMSWRERSRLFHEECFKLTLERTKEATRPVFFLCSETIPNEKDSPEKENTCRNVVDTGLDFEVDLTDLESFGESSKPTKTAKVSKTACGKAAGASSQTPSRSPQKQTNPDPSKNASMCDDASFETLDSTEDKEEPDSMAKGLDESADSEEKPEDLTTKRLRKTMTVMDCDTDSDSDRLIIDQTATARLDVSPLPVPHPVTSTPANASGKLAKTGIKRPRISGQCDQLSQILRMQDAMLKSAPNKNQEPTRARVMDEKPLESKSHSLVKQCVTSYLESKESQIEDPNVSAGISIIVGPQKKRLLKDDLQASAEDEKDYDPPVEGSVLYKLYSLLDILLMVRSSVNTAHLEQSKETLRAIPINVLPKLEYQLCYGAECLTHSEACRLWGEKLLHSSTVSYIGRINALTAEVAQIQELAPDWIENTNCDFNPARCLNNLHHILKKISGLQEGQYLLVHKPREGFVTILKSSNDPNKITRGCYNLHSSHGRPPALSQGIPWIPVDPSHILPIHQKYNRPPCTFPLRASTQPNNKKGKKKKNKKGNQNATRPIETTASGAANQNQAPKKKKNKKAKFKKNQPKQNTITD